MRAATESGRRLAVVLALVVATVVGGRGAVAQPFERLPRSPKRLAIVEFRNYLLDPAAIFRESGDVLPYDAALKRAVAYVEQRLAAEADLRIVGVEAVRDMLAPRPSSAGTPAPEQARFRLELILRARDLYEDGLEKFRELRLEPAKADLSDALKLYLELFQDLVDPVAVGRLQLYLGLTLAELAADADAHIALKHVFFHDPRKRFQRGYYAPKTEKALEAALVDFLFSSSRDLVLVTPERSDRFLTDYGLDGLVYGYLERDATGHPRLHVVFYERAAGGITFRDSVVVTGGPDDDEALDRLLTRALSCGTWPAAGAPPPEPLGLHVDAGFLYSVFAEHPTREIFHNLGFAVGFAYQLGRFFDVFAHVGVLSTLSDPQRDLTRTATSTRIVLGAGFAHRVGRVRFFVHPGLDLTYIGNLQWTTNPFCKFYSDVTDDQAVPPLACRRPAHGDVDDSGIIGNRRDVVHGLSEPFLFGLNLTLGLSVFLSGELYFDAQVSASSYLLPYDQTATLNFPLNLRVGLGYGF